MSFLDSALLRGLVTAVGCIKEVRIESDSLIIFFAFMLFIASPVLHFRFKAPSI